MSLQNTTDGFDRCRLWALARHLRPNRQGKRAMDDSGYQSKSFPSARRPSSPLCTSRA